MLVYVLFDDDLSISVSNDFERSGFGPIKALSQFLSDGTEETHGNSRSVCPISWPRLQPYFFRMQLENLTEEVDSIFKYRRNSLRWSGIGYCK
jgi:hypothetical protein